MLCCFPSVSKFDLTTNVILHRIAINSVIHLGKKAFSKFSEVLLRSSKP